MLIDFQAILYWTNQQETLLTNCFPRNSLESSPGFLVLISSRNWDDTSAFLLKDLPDAFISKLGLIRLAMTEEMEM